LIGEVTDAENRAKELAVKMADENKIELNPNILSLWVINPDKIVYEQK
jgi:hypothetical protein